jgi:glycosyltransferase involved in cell wall biosynthesis
MRVALLTPSYWPEVRRGSERLVHDLGAALMARDHEVTVLTSHRARRSVAIEDGMRVVRAWRPPELPGLATHELHLLNVPNAFLGLLRGNYDVAHATFPSDSWAAVKARRFGGPPVVASFHGVPTREYLVARRHRLEMMSEIAASAEECTVLSEAAARPFRRYLRRDPRVLPGGVNRADYEREVERTPEPTLLCASSLGDPRKRAGLLFAAFGRLRERRPDARLLIVRSHDPIMSRERVELPEAAHWVEAESAGALADAYASAWATVNPAPGEAFGLVLVESLAAGTPVVADNSGAATEILAGDQAGRLFASDDEAGLAKAMDEALELALSEGIREACRRRAAAYDWSTVVEAYEETYAAAAAPGDTAPWRAALGH